MKNLLIAFNVFILTLSSCGQKNVDTQKLGETQARNELKIALSDTTIHNLIYPNSIIIKDKETIIKMVEPLLFATYTRENIMKQRPYKAYLVDKYWVISGTLPNGYLGGNFLIIVDATNSKIIRLTHGK